MAQKTLQPDVTFFAPLTKWINSKIFYTYKTFTKLTQLS